MNGAHEGGNTVASLAAEDLEALEELEDVRAYDEAKASDDEVVPFEEAIQEIAREKAW